MPEERRCRTTLCCSCGCVEDEAAAVDESSAAEGVAATRLGLEEVMSVDKTRLETRNRTQMWRNNEGPPPLLLMLLLPPLSRLDRVFLLLLLLLVLFEEEGGWVVVEKEEVMVTMTWV